MSASNKEEKKRFWLTFCSGATTRLIYLFIFHSLSDSSQLTVLVLQGSLMPNGMLGTGKMASMFLLKDAYGLRRDE